MANWRDVGKDSESQSTTGGGLWQDGGGVWGGRGFPLPGLERHSAPGTRERSSPLETRGRSSLPVAWGLTVQVRL